MLMKDRLSIGKNFHRANSFNTAMGMAFSVINDNMDEKKAEETESEKSGSDTDEQDDKKGGKHAHHQIEQALEAERQIQ